MSHEFFEISKKGLIKQLQEKDKEDFWLVNQFKKLGKIRFIRLISPYLGPNNFFEDKLRVKHFIEALPFGVYVLNSKGYIRHLNNKMAKMLGFTDASLLISKMYYSPEFIVSDIENLKREIFNSASESVSYHVKLPNGHIFTLDDKVNVIRNKKGNVDYIIGICTEELKVSHIEFNRNHKDLCINHMLKVLPHFDWVANSDGVFSYINLVGLKNLGYSNREVQNNELSLYSLIIPQEHNKLKESIQNLVDGVPDEGVEYIATRQDGSRFPVLIFLTLSFAGNNEKVIKGVTIDISKLKTGGDLLSLNEKFLGGVLDAAAETSIIAVDTKGKILVFNKGAEKILGYTKEEVIGRITPLKFHLKTELKALQDEILDETGFLYKGFGLLVFRAKKEGNEIREWNYLRKDGTTIQVSLSVSVVKNESGEIIGYLGIARDITLEKLARRTLINSELKYRTLFENMGDAAFTMDYQVFLACNDKATTIFNCKKSDIIGSSPIRFSPVYQPDGQTSFEKAANYIKNALNGAPQFFEWVHTTFDGQEFYAEVSLVRIKIEEEYLLQAIVRNVDERKKSDELLIKSNQLFQTLASISPVGIFRTDEKGKTTYVNPKWSELSGIEFPDALEDKWLKVVHPDDSVVLIKEWKERSSKGERSSAEYRFVKPDGSIVWVMGYAVPEIIDGKVKGFVGTITDISDRKKAEIELQEKNKLIESKNIEYQRINEKLIDLNDELIMAKNKAEESERLKSAFLANMSHEIRTPLNGIMGFAHLLSVVDLDENERKELTATLDLSCNRLLDTVNNILDISKIDAGQTSVNAEYYRPVKLIKELFSFQLPNFKRNRVELIIDYGSALKNTTVFGDEQKVYQVINNLLDNAFKFTPNGRVVLGCYLNENSIVYFVSDTGIGIAKERQEFVFGRFNQENVNLNREYEGSGLGLAITKGLVELMGGTITLESEKGKGSTFTVNLPLIFQ